MGYTYLLWSKICTLPHTFRFRFAWWRWRWRLRTQRSTGVLWRTWRIATPLWWNMRWLRPHDFKQENAHENFTFVWPCIVTYFFIIKPTKCTNFKNLFWYGTLHVSNSSSDHHQEFIHCTLSSGVCHTSLQTAFQAGPGLNSINLWN